MKNKKAKSKVQAILIQKNMKIVDLFNRIKEDNKKPVAKYMISQIVNGKRTNYEILTLVKICKALGVTPNDIIEDNPTRYSSTKSIKSNIKDITNNTPKKRAKKSGYNPVVPPVVDVNINSHSGNGYIDEVVDEKSLEDIKRTLNMEEVKNDEPDWKEEIINDIDNKWGNGFIKEDDKPIVEHDGMRYNPETLETPEQEEEEDDFGF